MNLILKKCLAGQCWKNLLSSLKAEHIIWNRWNALLYLFPCIHTVCEFRTHLTTCLEKHTLDEAFVLVVGCDNGVLGVLSLCLKMKQKSLWVVTARLEAPWGDLPSLAGWISPLSLNYQPDNTTRGKGGFISRGCSGVSGVLHRTTQGPHSLWALRLVPVGKGTGFGSLINAPPSILPH